MTKLRVRCFMLTTAALTCLSLSACLSDKESNAIAGATPPNGNAAPTITGVPSTAVLMGTAYLFTPSASDPDGDAMTFSIDNLPRWASFDTVTGEVSGTPTLGDIGVFSDIIVSVSDRIDTDSLSAFSITVTQMALGSISLSWTPPTQNDDGTPLLDLAGYNLYYGTQPGDHPSSIHIDNPGMSDFVIENLQPGTYYVVATAFNDAGMESAFSNETAEIAN